jgi:hypothetical protein
MGPSGKFPPSSSVNSGRIDETDESQLTINKLLAYSQQFNKALKFNVN